MTEAEEKRMLEIPAELWEECPSCHQLLYSRELEKELRVCTKCGYHFRLSVWQRLGITADQGSFEEWDEDLPLHDPLGFPEYLGKLEGARTKTAMSEAVLTGQAQIGGVPVGLGIMDLGFVGGSMGWVVGERVTRVYERCAALGMPAVVFCASGGARMQESLVSLMQMPKTAAAARRLRESGQLYVSVLTDPTYGGVTASYAFLGDIIMAEPRAMMGFAGPRVVEVTKLTMPPEVQTAEFQYQHGMIDMIVPRGQVRDMLEVLLKWASDALRPAAPAGEGGAEE